MRSLCRVLGVLLLLSGAIPPPVSAATDTLAALAGGWHCTVAGRKPADRFYYLFSANTSSPSRTLYGRMDTVEPDGSPSVTFERIEQRGDGTVTIEAIEGNAAASSAAAVPLAFTGTSQNAITYAVDGDTMQRVATVNKGTVDSERCVRIPEKPVDASCAVPNAPATTLKADEPAYPAAAIASRASGIVQVIVILDDHSRVMWTDVAKSDNPVFNDEAVRAARLSTYRAAIRNCKPVAARYLFTVDFTGR
jgi:hypothetical protein